MTASEPVVGAGGAVRSAAGAMRRVTTSTIDIGKLTIGLFDPASQATRVARRRVQDAQYQQGSRQELPQPREGYGQAVQELSPRDG